MPSCMAPLLYCERGACGPEGACRFCCCSSTFFNESRMPPEVGGAIGVAPPAGAGCDCDAGGAPLIELGLRSEVAYQDRNRLVRKKPNASTAVVRVSRLAVPRLDMKPAPPPTPSPPPSDFCNRTHAINVATIIRWITIATVCISNLPSQTTRAGLRLLEAGLPGLKWRGVTRSAGALSPPPATLVS